MRVADQQGFVEGSESGVMQATDGSKRFWFDLASITPFAPVTGSTASEE